MRGRKLMVGALVALLALMMTAGAVWGKNGGAFVDVTSDHPAYQAIRTLVDKGIIHVGADGEFQGSQPLLRYDAAEWLYRTMQQAAAPGQLEDFAGRLSTVENQVGSVSDRAQSLESELRSVNNALSSLRQEVAGLEEAAAPAQDVARRVQTNFILGVTAVVLGVAALAVSIFF